MNVLTIIAIVLILLFALRGYHMGALKLIMDLAIFALTVVIVWFATPYTANLLREHTQLEQSIEGKLYSNMMEQEGDGMDMVDSLPLPDSWKNQAVIQEAVDASKEAAAETISSAGAAMLMDCISFLITLVVVFIALRGLAFAFDIIGKLPVIHGVNKILGLCVGGLQGLILLWLLLLLVTVFSTQGFMESIAAQIYESPILSFLYDKNPIAGLFIYFFD